MSFHISFDGKRTKFRMNSEFLIHDSCSKCSAKLPANSFRSLCAVCDRAHAATLRALDRSRCTSNLQAFLAHSPLLTR